MPYNFVANAYSKGLCRKGLIPFSLFLITEPAKYNLGDLNESESWQCGYS